MSFVLTLFAAGLAAQQSAPDVVKPAPIRVTFHLVAVRYDCILVDTSGRSVRIAMKKSGRATYRGDYTAADRANLNPQFVKPEFRILAGSDARFRAEFRYLPGGGSNSPSYGDAGDVVFLDSKATPVAMFRFSKSYDISRGAPIAAFLPSKEDPKLLETLGGVCAQTRLKDEMQ